MGMKNLRVLVADDNIIKSMDIKKALEFNGIKDIKLVGNQEAVWEEIEKGEEDGKEIDLIVTDMHYPLSPRQEADHNAGFILLDELKRKGKDIPVIICSSINYNEPAALGCVWYNKLADMDFDFQEVLKRLSRTT